MYTALVSAETAATSGFSVGNLAILVVVLIIAVPLFRRLRKSVSRNRKQRWVDEGLMDPPAADPEKPESSEKPGQSSGSSGQ